MGQLYLGDISAILRKAGNLEDGETGGVVRGEDHRRCVAKLAPRLAASIVVCMGGS